MRQWRLRAACSGIALALPACSSAGNGPNGAVVATLSGQITYRERMALPPEAVAYVELVDVTGTESQARTIAEQRITSVEQVPIRFTLSYDPAALDPARYYALRARIDDGSGLVLFNMPEAIGVQPWRGAQVEMLVQRVGRRAEGDASGGAAPATIACEGLRFSVEFPDASTVRMLLPDDTVLLTAVRAASGARYANDRIDFWNKGDETTVVIDGRTLHCRVASPANDPWERARAAGVDVRAVGEEPGWALELTEAESLVLVTDYGRRREVFLRPERANAERGGTVYRGARGGRRVEVTVRAQPCTDTMSGEAFPLTVTVTLGDEQLQGCGRRLR